MLFTTNSIKYFKERTKLQICRDVHKFMSDDLIRRIKTALEYDEHRDLMDLLLVVSLGKRTCFSEYNEYYQAQIRRYHREKKYNDLKRLIDYYATFVYTNGAGTISYAFLKFDLTWYKTFLVFYFRRAKKGPALFEHVEAFFKLFVYTKSPVLIDVFNSVPYIDRTHPCVAEVYFYVHEIMCMKECYTCDYKGSFETLMMPFLLKMPALFVKNNHALIYHAEKLKLNNFNYTGIIEYLKDERTLLNGVVDVFGRIHREVRLRSSFKEEYVWALLVLARDNRYESADAVLTVILEILLEENLCGWEEERSESGSDTRVINESVSVGMGCRDYECRQYILKQYTFKQYTLK
ncbi:1-phosphatidylinositol 4-kinase [Trachipleistophora hominis]|uniref:1-phosphatidylinositol 4-kinase n=1 Tax=Trachipleistophora hominis TaxID=72359 RepID=L7JUE8_TRAHO|nr:1-phosphatidylinositol 4-kinase [Trachipleistophora hominis]